MRITPEERDNIVKVFREETELASERIAQRLDGLDCRADSADPRCESVRRFYEDLSGKRWSDADDECLATLGHLTEQEIKAAMREAFRRSMVHPIPSFRYLISLSKKPETITGSVPVVSRNPDAVSAAERERLANLLAEQLAELAGQIVVQLGLSDSKAEILREHLEVAEGRIIGRLTPLI
jgi:hypothetical protein